MQSATYPGTDHPRNSAAELRYPVGGATASRAPVILSKSAGFHVACILGAFRRGPPVSPVHVLRPPPTVSRSVLPGLNWRAFAG